MSRGELILTVHSASDLKHPSSIGISNPYVKLTLSAHQHFKTATTTEQISPAFEQAFTFRITGNEQSMKIEMKLQGLFTSSVSSSADVQISQLLVSGVHNIRLLRDGRDVGLLVISSHFTPDPNQFNTSPQNQQYAQPVKEQPSAAPFNPSVNPSYPGANQPYPPASNPDAPPSYEETFTQPSAPNGLSPPPQQYQQQPYEPQQFQQQPSPPPAQYQQPPYSPQAYQQPAPQQYQQYPQPPFAQPMASWPPQPVNPIITGPPVVVMTHPPFGARAKLVGHPHHLEHRKHVYRGSYGCNHCHQDRRGPAWHCEVDNYDLCPQCFMHLSQPGVHHHQPIPTHIQPVQAYKDARHPHLLTLQSQLYMNSPRPGHYRCDSCNRPGSGQAFHCQTCSYDLHPQCFRQG